MTVDMARPDAPAADLSGPLSLAYHPSSDPGLGAGGAAPVAADAHAAEAEASPAERLPSILESLLLAADRPLAAADLAALVGERDADRIQTALLLLSADYEPRGIHLHEVAGGWQLRTNPQNAPWVQKLLTAKPVRMTRAQLETLAIVGYRQPITRPEVDEIRGVDSGGTLKTLLDRTLVRILGKKEEAGRPLLYGTTKDFLQFFNLRDLRDLPTLREFHELTEEHQAQVAALEGAATPGTIEPPDAAGEPGVPATLSRVDLPDVAEEDMSHIDSLIDQAGAKAQAASKAISDEAARPAEGDGDPGPPPPPPGSTPAPMSPQKPGESS
ncbi:MAG: SMC-Scp complex subunit ScpB [Myxococcales bacterium]|nr:SMC-Scp complex subunit ScpB [Myxococcales bacterium]